ncbi:MAG: hypothetical protein WCF17_17435, partial [Terracidiphilus sp.]
YSLTIRSSRRTAGHVLDDVNAVRIGIGGHTVLSWTVWWTVRGEINQKSAKNAIFGWKIGKLTFCH